MCKLLGPFACHNHPTSIIRTNVDRIPATALPPLALSVIVRIVHTFVTGFQRQDQRTPRHRAVLNTAGVPDKPGPVLAILLGQPLVSFKDYR